MKLLLKFLLISGMLFLISCKKDPPTLNEKLEGSWQVTYYKIYDIIWSDDSSITNGIAFKNEGTNTGTVWFAEHRSFAGTKDTITGSYILDENVGTLNIKWEYTLNPNGITEYGTYNVNLVADTLTLTHLEPHGLNVTARSVRN